jgi:hypothetical protein
MIALQTIATGAYLDLASASIGVEINNPFFHFDSVPGIITYPFNLPGTPNNLRALNFPHLRADQGEVPAPEPVAFYVDGLLWRVGQLLYQEWDGEKNLFQYQFSADAADLQSQVEGVTLRTLDLGSVPLELRPDAADYALPPVRNAAFYDPAKNPAYGGYLNYYDTAGLYSHNATGLLRFGMTPFLRLVPLLRRVLQAAVGYTISGPWMEDPEVQQLVLYGDRAVDGPFADPLAVVFNRHVPDLGVGEFLVALQQFFCLGYVFNAQRRTLHIRALREVVADQAYQDRTAAGPPRTKPAEDGGYTLKMALAEDDQNNTLDTGWATLRVGGGQEVIDVAAGTLRVQAEADALSLQQGGNRQWLVPTIAHAGVSPEFELDDETSAGLLLLFDRGLCPAAGGGAPYPLATWGSTDAAGTRVGEYELRWDGPRGLYAAWHQPWLDFLRRASSEERLMAFTVADLLALDPARKEMVLNRKYLWEKVSVSLSTTKRLATARFTYRSIKL